VRSVRRRPREYAPCGQPPSGDHRGETRLATHRAGRVPRIEQPPGSGFFVLQRTTTGSCPVTLESAVSTPSHACDLPKLQPPRKQESNSPASLIRGCGLLLIWNKRGPFSMRWMMRTSRSGEGPRAKRAPTEAEALSLTGPTRLLRQ
jgi:hypothetical protein